MPTNPDTSAPGNELIIADPHTTAVAVSNVANDGMTSSIYRVIVSNGVYSLDYFPIHELPDDPDSLLLFLNPIIKAGVSASRDSWIKELAAGSAFRIVRKQELWKRQSSCKSLKQYCRKEYHRSLSTLLDWEKAAEMNDFIGPNPSIPPENYSQVLALECIIPALRLFIWETGAAENGGYAPSGPLVRKVGEREHALTDKAKLEIEERLVARALLAAEKEKSAPSLPNNTFVTGHQAIATAYDALAAAENLQARLSELRGPESDEAAEMMRLVHFLQREAAKLERLAPPLLPQSANGTAPPPAEDRIIQPTDPVAGTLDPNVVQNSKDAIPTPPSPQTEAADETGRIIRPSSTYGDIVESTPTANVETDQVREVARTHQQTPASPPADRALAEQATPPTNRPSHLPAIVNAGSEATIEFADEDHFGKYKNNGQGFIPQRFGFQYKKGLWRLADPDPVYREEMVAQARAAITEEERKRPEIVRTKAAACQIDRTLHF